MEKALAEAERAKELKPWLIQIYEEFNSIYVDVAVQQFLRGREEVAGRTLRRMLAVTREVVTKKDTLSPRLQSLWDTRRDLSLTPVLALTAGQSALLLEDYKQAVEYLARAAGASDKRTKTIVQLWLGAALQKAGDPSGAALMQEARRSSREAEAEYAAIKQLVEL